MKLATPKRIVQARHKFAEIDVITETCSLMKEGYDDHGRLSQGNKRHHRSIGNNLHLNIGRLNLISIAPFLTKVYQFFRKLFIGNDLLPSFSDLKSKLLNEKM
jgi:hypothetical protein